MKSKNWQLFTEKFGTDYEMHDAVIKRFNLNGDSLTIVVNTLYETDDDKVYDINSYCDEKYERID